MVSTPSEIPTLARYAEFYYVFRFDETRSLLLLMSVDFSQLCANKALALPPLMQSRYIIQRQKCYINPTMGNRRSREIITL